ncbi:MAG: metallophosphoesterase [Deltaproteobacteria bacterium]|nr:metallophosphoesterase [Deltaproteobacteria bacterium]
MNQSNRKRSIWLSKSICKLTLFSLIICPDIAFPEGNASSFLRVPPFLGRPTQSSITLNLVAGDQPIVCSVKLKSARKPGMDSWRQTQKYSLDASSPAEILLQSLLPGTLYPYQLHARFREGVTLQMVTTQAFMTQRSEPSPFSFAIISDSHITPFHRNRLETLSRISSSVLTRKPEFLLMLGDNIQTFTSHGGPMSDPRYGPLLYLLLRRGLGNLPSSVPVFMVNGNWEGENGWHPAREREWARLARKTFIPNPDATTYPEGGSGNGDYYGFTWGDVLCLILNVTGYTPSDHALNSPTGRKDDWTLGDKQKAWLFQQLSESNARWKLLFIHHTAGGNGGDEINSRYGRGGGRAANIGEQALIHRWMQQFGVQALFYGHDHVFTDTIVDGIHYTCVGSAGAPWKFGRAETGYDTYWTPSGYTWVDVDAGSLTVSFIRPDERIAEGVVLHSYVMEQSKER